MRALEKSMPFGLRRQIFLPHTSTWLKGHVTASLSDFLFLKPFEIRLAHPHCHLVFLSISLQGSGPGCPQYRLTSLIFVYS